jgi:integrase
MLYLEGNLSTFDANQGTMASIKIILREDKTNEKGESPLYLRITHNRKSSFVSLKIYVLPNQWNKAESKVRKNYPNSVRMNAHLANELAKAHESNLQLQSTRAISYTAHGIVEKMKGPVNCDFFQYAENHLAMLLAQKRIGSYKRTKSVLAKFKQFNKSASLDFNDIDVSMLNRFEYYLLTEFKNATNTVHANFRVIKALINQAIREDLITADKNPFLKFKLKLEKTNKAYLIEEEIKRLEELDLKARPRLQLHRDMFIFSSYAGGIRISDLLMLRKSNFDGNRISFRIQKTKSPHSFKLPDKALEILETYNKPSGDPNDFLFPSLKIANDCNDKTEIFNAISSTTARINMNLKIIAKMAEIDKKVSFHVSRHSFATRALTKGISLDKVSKIMGHQNIKETQGYAKIISEELDKAMNTFN